MEGKLPGRGRPARRPDTQRGTRGLPFRQKGLFGEEAVGEAHPEGRFVLVPTALPEHGAAWQSARVLREDLGAGLLVRIREAVKRSLKGTF